MKKILLSTVIIAAVLTPMVLAASPETEFHDFENSQNQISVTTNSDSLSDFCPNETPSYRRNSNNCGY